MFTPIYYFMFHSVVSCIFGVVHVMVSLSLIGDTNITWETNPYQWWLLWNYFLIPPPLFTSNYEGSSNEVIIEVHELHSEGCSYFWKCGETLFFNPFMWNEKVSKKDFSIKFTRSLCEERCAMGKNDKILCSRADHRSGDSLPIYLCKWWLFGDYIHLIQSRFPTLILFDY